MTAEPEREPDERTDQLLVPYVDPTGFDWQRLPVGTRTSTFDAPSGPLAMASWGEPGATRVLILPGVTGSKEDFSLVGPILADHGYRVDSVDIAGQYESDGAGPQPGGRYDLELHTRDALALLDADPGPTHLVGYSFEGIVASEVLVRRPGRLRSLTYLSTPPLTGNALRGVRILGRFSRFIAPQVPATLMWWGATANVNRTEPSRIRFVRHRFHRTKFRSLVDAMRVMMHVPDHDAELRASGVPFLVCAGHGDMWPMAQHEAFAERLGARLCTYDTGHRPSETAPSQFARDLLTFYRSIDA